MEKTVTYLYPDTNKASSLKMFQDRTNQIKGFYFTKDNTRDVEKLPSASNYAVYFLFDNSENDERRVYVGQSMNGVSRIGEHAKSKDFWNYCIMFVTDNNSFDKLSIDYLEYEFINRFKKSSYILTNKDLRTNEPNISVYDKPNLIAFIDQIEFLLSAEGIMLSEKEIQDKKYYYPSRKGLNAKLYVKDGKFILEKGSVIKRPIESSKDWKDTRFYTSKNSLIDEYLDDGKAGLVDGEIVTLVELQYDSPSLPASLISGSAENGWMFFKELNELRKSY